MTSIEACGTAVVTGASKGIGPAMETASLAAGYDLASKATRGNIDLTFGLTAPLPLACLMARRARPFRTLEMDR